MILDVLDNSKDATNTFRLSKICLHEEYSLSSASKNNQHEGMSK